MIPGYWPGPSGQTAKLGIRPYFVVTTTSFSIIARILVEGYEGAQPCVFVSSCHADFTPANPRLFRALRSARWAEQSERVRHRIGGGGETPPDAGQPVQIA